MPDGAESLFNPFPGLRSFESDETHLFFGRDGQSDELLRILARNRFVAVVGTSGSGKSSLVRAGVLPALQRGFMVGAGSSWRIATMRPGAHPIENLATALNSSAAAKPGELAPNSRHILIESILRRNSFGLIEAGRITRMAPRENLLVVVDQFEEIFRLKFERVKPENEEEDTATLVRLLLEATRQIEFPIYVAITMRSDFLGDCAQFQDLPETMNHAQYLIPRMTREQRREAIEGPVAVGGGTIAPRLVQKLLNDVGDAPDQLPILQHALMRTWDAWQRQGKIDAQIDLDHYESIGGMSDALSRHADEAYSELDDTGRLIARRLFECISHRGPDNREIRRPTLLSEICGVAEADEASLIRVIDCFRTTGRTFLVPPAPERLGPDSIIDISHEALIRLWGRLRQWTVDEAESAATYKRLADDAARHAAGRASLLREPALSFTLAWKENRHPNAAWARRYAPGMLFLDALDFLERSRRARELSKWSWRVTFVSGFAFAIVFMIVAITATRARREAQHQRTLALSRQLVADAMSIERDSPELLDLSALLAIESAKREPQLESDRFLRRAGGLLQKNLFNHRFVEAVSSVSFSADSKYLVIASGSIAAVSDAKDSHEVSRYTHDAAIYAVACSPDGSLVAAGGADGTVLVFAAATGKLVERLHEDSAVLAVAFDPSGHLVATGSSDQTVRVFEAISGRQVWHLSQEGPVVSVAFSPDGRLLATGSQDSTARVYEAATGKEVSRLAHDSAVFKVAFSPDGRFVATGSADDTARVFEAATGKELSKAFHGDAVYGVAFSPDGRYVATASLDDTARVFKTATGEEVSKFVHADSVNAVAFSPDGRYVATASKDRTARVFEARNGMEVSRLTHEAVVQTVAFSADGRYLATGSAGGVVGLFDLAKEGQVSLRTESQPTVVSVSADGRIVAAAAGKTVELFDAASGKETSRLNLDSKVQSLAVSAEDHYLATGGKDNTARVFEIATGKEVSQLHHDSIVDAVAFSPDARFLATGSLDQSARVFDLATGRQLSQLKHESIVDAVAFSPDSRRVATGSYDGTARVFEAATGKQICQLKQSDTVDVVAFSPDGNFVASGSLDKTTRVFDAATGKQIWRKEHTGSVSGLAFSKDGRYLLASSSGKPDKTVWALGAGDGREVSEAVSENTVAALALEQNDSVFATVSLVGDLPEIIVQSYPLHMDALVTEVCSRLKRNLTREEWKRYLQTEAYQKSCADLP